jgi:hypothetical protein
MQVVINIDDKLYNRIKYLEPKSNTMLDVLMRSVQNGTPLPKGHGDLIDRKLALSDAGLCEFHRYGDYVKMRNYLKSIPTIIEADKGE